MYCDNLCWTMFPGWLSKFVPSLTAVLQWLCFYVFLEGQFRGGIMPYCSRFLSTEVDYKRGFDIHTMWLITIVYRYTIVYLNFMYSRMDMLYYMHILHVYVICVRLGKKLMCRHQDVPVAACSWLISLVPSVGVPSAERRMVTSEFLRVVTSDVIAMYCNAKAGPNRNPCDTGSVRRSHRFESMRTDAYVSAHSSLFWTLALRST